MNATQTEMVKAMVALEITTAQPIVGDDDSAWLDAHDAFVSARSALFAWTRERVATDPKTARTFAAVASDIDGLFAKAPRYPQIAQKLVDLCLRLEA